MIPGQRNVSDENTLNYLENFIRDLKELLHLYEISRIHGFDNGTIVMTTFDGKEYDLCVEEDS